MDDQRTADPTLTAYLEEEGDISDVTAQDPYEDGAVAHRIATWDTTTCGRNWGEWYTHPVFLARWVCRPCRRCFPHAPPPGRSPSDEPGVGSLLHPGLAWQVRRP